MLFRSELSYGSHIFQDLVEAGILYSAIFEGSSTRAFRPEMLKQQPNRLQNYVPNSDALKEVISVCETAGSGITLYYDMASEHLLITADP